MPTISRTTEDSYCKKGHLRRAGLKPYYCPTCAKEYRLKNVERQNKQQKAWYQKNKARHKVARDRWYENNRDRLHELQRDWYVKNRELHLARSKEWSANNLGRKAAYRRARRAKITNAPGFATSEQVRLRMEYHRNTCVYCRVNRFEEVDHAIPLDRGGSNWPSNLVPSCRPCNRRKHTKTIWEFKHDQ